MDVLPGFSEDGLSIINPGVFVENILKNRISRAGLFRISNPPIFIPHQTTVPAELAEFPNIENTYSPNYSGMLEETISQNQKSYLKIPSFGSFTRISASGKDNSCWFDSFLCCMSSAYRSISLENRQRIFPIFRRWCFKNSDKILSQKPTILNGFYTNKEFTDELQSSTSEISVLAGFLIAWFFGVNIIYIKMESSGPIIDTLMSTQSPDCKTIFMSHIGGSGAGAHYEPVGILGLTADQKLDETTSTFMFDWSDQRICQMQNLPTTWTLPRCKDTNSGSVGSANTNNTANRASVGGKRRKSRRSKKRMGKKRRTIRKR
jgi:hypothetical protein